MARAKRLKKTKKIKKNVTRKTASHHEVQDKVTARSKEIKNKLARTITARRSVELQNGVPFDTAYQRLRASAEIVFRDKRVRSLGISRHGDSFGYRAVRNSAMITPESVFQYETNLRFANDLLSVPVTFIDTPHEVEHHLKVPYSGPGSPTAASSVPEQGRVRPLCTGLQIQNYDDDLRSGVISKGYIVVGTLGCFVKLADGSSALLSNNHVVAAENRGKKGSDRILQAGGGAFVLGDQIGVLNDFVELKPSPPNASVVTGDVVFNDVDAGVVTISDGTQFGQGYHSSRSISASMRAAPPNVGDKVFKVGRTTGLTYGHITDIATIVGPITYDPGPCWFQGSITVEGDNGTMFSDKGDSGSVIVRTSGEILGLLYAGNGQQTYACTIESVFRALNCNLP